MAAVHGFERLRAQDIPELKTKAELYRHVKTGAELLSLMNEDENKVFGISFRTPPLDSTGTPHILEHSVLCGSRKYPLKEPFVELLKGSLQTFLNAMTYPDKTCYPVASQNAQDLYNLVDVYMDAVFYPRLTPFIFKQEGWHLEVEDGGRLIYKGVVYSEMKGAYSSPDNILVEHSRRALFPGNVYGLDAGGDPRIIPTLTYEKFIAFHRRYYHPSNARIFFYGDDDPEKRLGYLDTYLREFERTEVDSAVGLQPPFLEPARTVRPFATGEGVRGQKGMITLNWLLGETGDRELNLSFHILEYILLGMPGSPLRKALIDSKYGEDLAGQGLEAEIRQMYISTGLKGIDTGDADRIESLIFETLSGLSKKGIDPLTVEAAMNSVEFALRENNTGSYPRGLALMLRALATWLYGGDPLALISFEEPLERVKSRLKKEKAYFEGLIERFFLNNRHRAVLLLKPDPGAVKRDEEEERSRLEALRASLTPSRFEEVKADAQELREIQETPDPPEALSSIPLLKRSDLGERNKEIPLSITGAEETRILYHDLFTGGIFYLDLGFDLHVLPQEYLPYVPLFGRALLEMGTEEEDYVSLTQRISRKTGGIHPSLLFTPLKGSSMGSAWLFLRGKAMLNQADELFGILKDVLLKAKLDHCERFQQMVLEAKARLEQTLVPAGHQMVNLRLRAHYDEAGWVAEKMRGVSQLLFLRELAERIQTDWGRVLSDLEGVRSLLVNGKNMIANVTLDQEGWRGVESPLRGFLDELPSSAVAVKEWSHDHPAPCEGLTIPAKVNYVGKGASLYETGYQYHGSARVITRHVRNSWLWDRVRVQGGAYGAFCMFDRLSGVLTFVSYRDPNLEKTLEVFDRSAEYLEGLQISEEELTKAVIGAIGDIDQYQLPDAKGYTSMVRQLSGVTEEERHLIRQQVLGTAPEDFRSFGRVLKESRQKGLIKVLGSEESVGRFASERPGLEVLKLL